MIVPQGFYEGNTLDIAKNLIGKVIVSRIGGTETRGIIVETEAYMGKHDAAAHSYKGKSERVRILYGEKGCAYVYLIYGMHWCLNVSAGERDEPECVLIRALEPLEGIAQMELRRSTEKLRNLCSGPGKLCKALGISGKNYGVKFFDKDSELIIEYGEDNVQVDASKRIGIDYAGEAKDYLWRFTKRGSEYLSK